MDAPSGNRTPVGSMATIHDTTTPMVHFFGRKRFEYPGFDLFRDRMSIKTITLNLSCLLLITIENEE